MRARVLLVPLVMAAAFLAGCTSNAPGATATSTPTPTSNGVDALTADEILAKATEAIGKASSFRIKGSAVEDGTKVAIDLVSVGKNTKGTVTGEGMTFDIVQVDGVSYVKADEFWRLMLATFIKDEAQRTMAGAALKGKYVKAPADKADDLKSFVPAADDLLKAEGAVTKGEATTIDGKPAITLTDASGNKIYVATTGEPYPLRVEAKTGEKMEIVEIGANATITAPAAADILDLEALAKQFGG
jgi:hypothetical protein